MTEREFSYEFDILWNNINSNQAPGLDEYEKSVFLTQAQEAYVLQTYQQMSVDRTEECRRILKPLIKIAMGNLMEDEGRKINNKQVFYTDEYDSYLYILREECYKYETDDYYEVVPVTLDELTYAINNPFKSLERIFRIEQGEFVYYVSPYINLVKDAFAIRFTLLVPPEPIILENLEGLLSINGKKTAQTCKLDTSVHRTILSNAVQLAQLVWQTTNNNK